jgi:hypothetical protein
MDLNGSLNEFILADVFNLLTQQKITGKLTMNDEQKEGCIVFKGGLIVGAHCGDETLQNKLFNYLVDVKKNSSEPLGQLFNTHSGSLNALCASIVERSLMDSKELKNFADTCVEDITCSLLSWKSGSYRFNSLQSVAAMVCSSVTITADGVIMEGMRRADEWARMQDYITNDAVFVNANKNVPLSAEVDIFSSPETYILGLLDGSRTVYSIIKSCCLCEYKVYESINILLQSQRVIALSSKYSQSIQAALSRKDTEAASSSRTFFSSVYALSTAAAVFAFFLFIRLVWLSPSQETGAISQRKVIIRSQNYNNAQAAYLLHKAQSGEKANTAKDLKKTGLLTDHDLKAFGTHIIIE